MQKMLTADDIHSVKIGDKVTLKIVFAYMGNGKFLNSPVSEVDMEAEKEYTIKGISIASRGIRVENDNLLYRIERFAVNEPDPPTKEELSSALKFDESILDNLDSINFRLKS